MIRQDGKFPHSESEKLPRFITSTTATSSGTKLLLEPSTPSFRSQSNAIKTGDSDDLSKIAAHFAPVTVSPYFTSSGQRFTGNRLETAVSTATIRGEDIASHEARTRETADC
jgi:hypothetical protein